MRNAALLVAMVVSRTAGADPDFDAAFRDAASELAASGDRFVAGWGTVRLDGSRTPHHFATLMPNGGMGRGAYLIEQAPNALWLVTFNADGRTQPFAGGIGVAEAKVTWAKRTDTAIAHDQSHHHGGESITFALRNAQLVVLAYASTDDVTDKSERPIHHTFARATAPLLDSFYVRDSQLAIAGPARSVSALVEPVYSAVHIDWDRVAPKTDAEALAIWNRLAPTGEDLDKLYTIPQGPTALVLARAFLRTGNFTCPAAPEAKRCGLTRKLATPAATADLGDPCVRHALALWALQQLASQNEVVQSLAVTLRAIAKLPPPEGALVDAAILAAAGEPGLERELAEIAWRAGHHDSAVVDGVLANEASAALAGLIGDPVKAARTGDCATAALAAIVRERAGDTSLVPAPPANRDAAAMTRQLCVLAHYTALGGTHVGLDDFVTPGVGDPAPVEMLAARCAGATCTSDEIQIRFTYAPHGAGLLVSNIEATERPTCR